MYLDAVAALAIVLATQATNFVPMSPIKQKLFAILMLLIITTANVLSTKLASKIQFVATIAKLIPIIIIIALGLIKGTAHSFSLPVGTTSRWSWIWSSYAWNTLGL